MTSAFLKKTIPSYFSRETSRPHRFFSMLAFSLALFAAPPVRAEAPLLRLKAGVSSLTVNTGAKVVNESLGSMLTLQPTVLWELQSFSSRLGFHYLQETGGPFGVTPMTGLGISGYYHFFGLSTSHRKDEDGTILQTSRPGPFLFAAVTPVNFNMNRRAPDDPPKDLFFSSFAWDIGTGIGYDYPITQNMVFSMEYVLRNGSGSSGSNSSASDRSVRWSGSSIMLSFATSYH